MRFILLAACYMACIVGCALNDGFGLMSKKCRYEIHDGYVRYNSPRGPRRVYAADTTTFECLPDYFGKDKRYVFFGDKVVEDADPMSFVVIDSVTGRDEKSIYRASSHCKKCDVQSFFRISDDWYIDKNAAYSALLNGWRRITNVDAQYFKPLNDWFAKDNRSVFLNDRRIPGADAESFKLASCGRCLVCGEDKNRCYWFDHPVPCDCKPHVGAEFPSGMTEIPPGKAVIDNTAPVSFDVASLKGLGGVMSSGYWVITPSKQTVRLNCWVSRTRGSLPVEVTVDFEAGRLYRFKQKKNMRCEVKVELPALIQGRIDGPEVRIQVDDDPRPRFQVELPPGAHMMTAVCRDVTRSEVRELFVNLNLELKPGEIYKLHAEFKPQKNRCEVWATLLGEK